MVQEVQKVEKSKREVALQKLSSCAAIGSDWGLFLDRSASSRSPIQENCFSKPVAGLKLKQQLNNNRNSCWNRKFTVKVLQLTRLTSADWTHPLLLKLKGNPGQCSSLTHSNWLNQQSLRRTDLLHPVLPVPPLKGVLQQKHSRPAGHTEGLPKSRSEKLPLFSELNPSKVLIYYLLCPLRKLVIQDSKTFINLRGETKNNQNHIT